MPVPIRTKMSINDLRAYLRYDADAGVVYWVTAPGNDSKFRRQVGDVAGVPNSSGYLSISFNRKHFLAHRVAWALHFGEWPAGYIDHINGSRTDNRIANLRLATHQENIRNAKRPITNTTGYKGVRRKKGKFKAVIHIDGKDRGLGTYSTPEEAHRAYQAAAEKHFGCFANFG